MTEMIKANLNTRNAQVLCEWCFACALDRVLPGDFREVEVSGGRCSDCEQPFRVLFLSFGYVTDEYGESSTRYVVFGRNDITAEVRKDNPGEAPTEEQIADEAVKMSGFYEYYRGPGRAFGHEPYACVSRYRVLVKQHCGLD